MRIVIPGGTGQVGTLLARYFHQHGHDVTVLSRRPQTAPWRTLVWDARQAGAWIESLEGGDVCINLAGKSVNCRYYPKNRRLILDSRVQSTELLNRVIASLKHPPAVWINASTATIYRHALDKPMDEETGELGGREPHAPSTWNFSIEVAKAWEAAFFAVDTPKTRKVAIRSAMTFSPDAGGVFDVFLGFVRHGLGGRQGSGRQYVSWIHDADFVAAIEFLLVHTELSGTVNLASPNPLTNNEFLRALRQAWGTKLGLVVPRYILEIGTYLLRTESELVLKSRRVVPTRLLKAGFVFQFPCWDTAAQDLVKRWRQLH